MKNDYHIGDTKISVPPTLLFSVIARMLGAEGEPPSLRAAEAVLEVIESRHRLSHGS